MLTLDAQPAKGPRRFRLNHRSPQADGLIAWWPSRFPGARGIWDWGPRRCCRTTRYGSGTEWTPGADRQGFVPQYNGSDDYDTAIVGDFEDSPWTVSFWVMFRSGTTGAIVALGDSGASPYFGILRQPTTNYLRVYVPDVYRYGTQALSDDVVYHVAVTRASQTSGSMYLDGLFHASCDGTQAPASQNKRAYLGRWSVGAYANCLLDDVRIYRRVLIAAEIRALWAPDTRWELYEPEAPRLFPAAAAPPGAAVPWHLMTGRAA